MIDLHTHVLPGIDDGSKSVSESIQMLEDGLSQGITALAFTPHCIVHEPDDIEKFLAKRNASFETLQQSFDMTRLSTFLGAEVFGDHDISRHPDVDKLCIGQTGCLLMEFPIGAAIPWLSDCVYSLNLKGITVIIAHVDRYPIWEDILYTLSDLNVIYQLNAERFLTVSGRNLLRKIFKHDEMFFVSSDMHNMDRRRCNLAKAKDVADKKFKSLSEDLFVNNGTKIIEHTL